jgi:hypothetical protein
LHISVLRSTDPDIKAQETAATAGNLRAPLKIDNNT